MIKIDDNFRPRNILEYPPSNKQTFEEYFYDEYMNNNIKTDRIYIPVFWTNFYISKNYGNGDLSKLQKSLDSLDRDKKYFTIVQYDDNILNDLKDLDILIFAQGGYGNYKDKTYTIPLNCQTNYNNNDLRKDIFASFVGRQTHPIRSIIFDEFKNKEGYFISESIDYNSYKDVMSRSLFSLCPRGYGLTSFRICESLQVGSIPVYIYDEEFIPFRDEFEFNKIGIPIHENELYKLDNILKSKTENEINSFLKNGKDIYKNYFHYNGTKNSILEVLNKKNIQK
jgi:hypothetical protein